MAGKFLTLEGIDGAGKSTHLAWLAAHIRARGVGVVTTREPGGTPLGDALRQLLLHTGMDRESETLLMFAARAEHIHKVIRPALATGDWVISDRFTDATFAYQCGGRGVSPERVEVLETWVQQGLQPDLTLLFDAPLGVARKRIDSQTRTPDKFEREEEDFFARVRSAYLLRAQAFPRRIRVIDSAQPINAIRQQLEEAIAAL